jgi:uncharacterized protein (TIGR00369 family)
MIRFVDNGGCFVCGRHNPAGLQLDFSFNPTEYSARAIIVFSDRFQGWEKVVHGGLLATVLDEVMVKAAASRDRACVTGEMTVKYLAPVIPGATYTAGGKIVSERGKLLLAEGSLLDGFGFAVAKASAKLVRVG